MKNMGKSRQFGQEKMDLVQEKKTKNGLIYFDIYTYVTPQRNFGQTSSWFQQGRQFVSESLTWVDYNPTWV